MAYAKEQLLEMYRKLPKDIQDAIFSVDTAEIIREIGENNNLMIDKIGNLADETGLVMLGLTSPSQYIPHIVERLEISRETAKKIAEEVNSKIFFPIRENLKKIHGVEERSGEEEIPKDRPLEASEVLPASESSDIFEIKTKEISRSPIEKIEKTERFDPYREPLI